MGTELWNERFWVRKEDWGFLLQDLKNDRVWAMDETGWDSFAARDLNLSVFLENPFRYIGKFEIGDLPIDRTLRAPISISWSLTANCNSHCVFCCTDSINSNIRESDLKKVEKTLGVLMKWEVMRIVLGGGEPLVHPEIVDILEIFKEHNFYPVIATNGTLLKGDMADAVSKTCMNIQISLDTLNPEKYLRLRGIDELKNVMGNIRDISQRGNLVRIVTVLTTENVDELKSIADFLGACHIKQWFIFELLNSGRGVRVYDRIHIKKGEQAVQEVVEYVLQKYEDLSIWYWGNKPADGCAVYIMPDGNLNLVNYHNNESCVFPTEELNLDSVQAFWNEIGRENQQKVLDNFLAANRIMGERDV